SEYHAGASGSCWKKMLPNRGQNRRSFRSVPRSRCAIVMHREAGRSARGENAFFDLEEQIKNHFLEVSTSLSSPRARQASGRQRETQNFRLADLPASPPPCKIRFHYRVGV